MEEGLIRSLGRVGMRLRFAGGILARVYRETAAGRGPTLGLRTSLCRYPRLSGDKRPA
jgi:hypothetical protein